MSMEDVTNTLGAREVVDPARARARAQAQQRHGKALIVAGWIVSVVGIVAYCVASFAAGADAELGEILMENVAPFARATLGVLGLGTLLWLVGSVLYLRGALETDEASPSDDGPA